MDAAHAALLTEVRRRLKETKDDPNVKNSDGSNYWGPYVTRAVEDRTDDGPALVRYVKGVLRKTGESEGWSALLEGRRLDLSFEDVVLNAGEPIRSLFDDEDPRLAAESLGAQQDELDRRKSVEEADAVEQDRRVVARVAERRRAAGKPWTPDMEQAMLAERAARRHGGAA